MLTQTAPKDKVTTTIRRFDCDLRVFTPPEKATLVEKHQQELPLKAAYWAMDIVPESFAIPIGNALAVLFKTHFERRLSYEGGNQFGTPSADFLNLASGGSDVDLDIAQIFIQHVSFDGTFADNDFDLTKWKRNESDAVRNIRQISQQVGGHWQDHSASILKSLDCEVEGETILLGREK